MLSMCPRRRTPTTHTRTQAHAAYVRGCFILLVCRESVFVVVGLGWFVLTFVTKTQQVNGWGVQMTIICRTKQRDDVNPLTLAELLDINSHYPFKSLLD